MRLWHKDMIKYLPREQLVAQWRECSAIASNLNTKGTPNHILVNKITNYPRIHFVSYAWHIRAEMTKRGYRTMDSVWNKILQTMETDYGDFHILSLEELFPEWHNDTYWIICYYNLKEKWLCGGISNDDWNRIDNADAEWRLM